MRRLAVLLLACGSSPALAKEITLAQNGSLQVAVELATTTDSLTIFVPADWESDRSCVLIPADVTIGILPEEEGEEIRLPGLAVRQGATLQVSGARIVGTCGESELGPLLEFLASKGQLSLLFGEDVPAAGLLSYNAKVILEEVAFSPQDDWEVGLALSGGVLEATGVDVSDVAAGPGIFLYGLDQTLDATLTDAVVQRNAGGGLLLRDDEVAPGDTPTLTLTSPHFESNWDRGETAVYLADGNGADLDITRAGWVLVEGGNFNDGVASGGGGSMLLDYTDVTLDGVAFTDSRATYGGALKLHGDSDNPPELALHGVSFTRTSAIETGGALWAEYVAVQVNLAGEGGTTPTTAVGTTADQGAFAWLYSGSLKAYLLDLQDWNNTGAGAAIQAEGVDELTVHNSHFCGGMSAGSAYGNALTVMGNGATASRVEVKGSVFQYTQATAASTTAVLGANDVHLTFWNNTLAHNADLVGVYLDSGELDLRNTLFYAQNTSVAILSGTTLAATVGYNLHEQVQNLLYDGTGTGPLDDTDLVDQDPLFFDSAYSSVEVDCVARPYLGWGSPAIDAGDPSLADRHDGTRPDIGAFGGPTSELGDGDGDGVYYGQDCDDTDPSRTPGNDEIWYDGVDNDCDSSTVDDDADGDGMPVDRDCDDNDPERLAITDELFNDGLDQDCDGHDALLSYRGGRGCWTGGPGPGLVGLAVGLALIGRRRR